MKLHSCILFLLFALCGSGQNWNSIGPFGGYFKDFMFHPSDPMTIYAGSDDGGGVWRSNDNGSTWTLLTEEYPNMTGWKLAFGPDDPNTLYACDLYGRYGLLRSTDSGENWTVLNNGLETTYDRMVSGIVPYDPDTLFISTGESTSGQPPRPGNGVFRSFDAGLSWQASGLQDTSTTCIGTNLFRTLFVGTHEHGLFYSNDRGGTWTQHPDIPVSATLHEIEQQGTFIVIGANEGVYLSSDNGVSFTNIGQEGNFNFDVAIHTLASFVQIFSSTLDGLKLYSEIGPSWMDIEDPELDGQLVIGLASNGSSVLASTFSNNLILRSMDAGGQWSSIETSPSATEINDLLLDPADGSKIMAAMMGSYDVGAAYNRNALRVTEDGGATWTFKGPEAHGLCLERNPLNSGATYLGTFSSGLFRSYDGFDDFEQLIEGTVLIGDIAISAVDTNVVLVSHVQLPEFIPSIRRSTDGGDSFSEVSPLAANRLLFDSNDNDTAFAATSNGLFLSLDQGATWGPWQLDGENIQSMYYGTGRVYAGTDAGAVYLIENGTSIDITGPWSTPVQVKSLFSTNGSLFVGLNGAEQDTSMQLSGGLWRTTDQGLSWTEITSDMYNTNVYGNNVIESDGNSLYVATYGGGIFRSEGLALSTSFFENPDEWSLWPNPVRDMLRIDSGRTSVIDYEVMDSKGASYTEEVQLHSSPNGQLILDCRSLSAGIYLLRINGRMAGRFVKR